MRIRYMKWFGMGSVILLLLSCFFPWIIVASKEITVSGVNAEGTNFGKPGYFHFIMAFLFIVFHLVNKLWAKRWNLLVVGLNLAWAVRNFIVISACRGGECPEKQPGLYLSLIASVLILLSALFPGIDLEKIKNRRDAPVEKT